MSLIVRDFRTQKRQKKSQTKYVITFFPSLLFFFFFCVPSFNGKKKINRAATRIYEAFKPAASEQPYDSPRCEVSWDFPERSINTLAISPD